MNIKYQRIIDLDDKLITQIITDIIKPLEIMDIIRDEQMEEVNVYVKTEWESFDDNDEKVVNIYTECITLTDPFISDGIETDGNYSFYIEDIIMYKQFCIANGVCKPYLHNNPYIEGN